MALNFLVPHDRIYVMYPYREARGIRPYTSLLAHTDILNLSVNDVWLNIINK